MNMKKILSVLAIVALFSLFTALDSGYAFKSLSKVDLPDGPETTSGKAEAERRINEGGQRKGSIYDGASYMIASGIYEGNATSRKNFQNNSGNNPDTSKPYSDSTIGREVTSMLEVGIMKQDANGDLYVKAGINHDVLDAVNEKVEELIPRKEAGTDRALGLRRFNLADLPEETLRKISAIVEENNLKNNAAVNIVAFDSEFAENYGEALLNIIKELRPDQVPIIVNATGRMLNLIPELANIHIEAVEVNSPAAEQFAEMFTNQKNVGLKGTLDNLKTAIAEGKVLI